MLAETMQNIWFAIYVNMAGTALNLIGACLLIYGAFQVRKGARINRETAEMLRDRQRPR